MVFDASTLILLAKAEILALVLKEKKGVVTPEVWREIQRGKGPDVRPLTYFQELGEIRIMDAGRPGMLQKLKKDFNLAGGEASSLVLAKEKNATLATDDRLAIRACKVLGIPFATAIHFLIWLRRKDKISVNNALTTLEKLTQFGRYQETIVNDAREKLKGGI